MTKTEKLEKQFGKLAQEIYECGERRIQPTWPWVLIRVCPKEQQIGGIYLPGDGYGDKSQNKPIYEGIVLATWKPHFSRFKKPGVVGTREVWRESDFEIGDRVLYPSFAGLPVNFLDEHQYRLIREWTFDELGGIFCKVTFDGDVKIKKELERVFDDLHSVTISGK